MFDSSLHFFCFRFRFYAFYFKLQKVEKLNTFSITYINLPLLVPKSPKKNPKYDPSKRERKQSSRQSQNVVYVLSEFALELMRILEAFNTENFQSDEKLRIGTNLVLFSIFFIVVSPPWFSCYCYC